jgi:phosphopantothenoylcysteine decarboxylase / phosphopantothenate---cysteine ligase
MSKALENKSILLVISGGIAAYKSLELIRLIRKSGGRVRTILTAGGAQFVTPLSIAALTEEQVYTDLFSLKDETEMGHIRLTREADLVVVAPASANLIAKLAWGLTDDLASTTLLASNKPILLAPAMNHMMWHNAATQENLSDLSERGILTVGPTEGDMACGEFGMGRMAEPEDIFNSITQALAKKLPAPKLAQKKSNLTYLKQTTEDEKYHPLEGFSALVTSGPTYEPIDPVRFIGNHSSGKQGIAIAKCLADAGVKVTLVTGPVSSHELSTLTCHPRFSSCHPREGGDPAKKTRIPAQGRHDNGGIEIIQVTTAAEMLKACEKILPVDIAVCAAAVADWSPEKTDKNKIKKSGRAPTIKLKENADILKTISNHKKRPQLVIGFAAETENLLKNAKAKLNKKNCDWILANDVSKGVFGADETHIHLVTKKTTEDWKKQSKSDVAKSLTGKIIRHFHRNQMAANN